MTPEDRREIKRGMVESLVPILDLGMLGPVVAAQVAEALLDNHVPGVISHVPDLQKDHHDNCVDLSLGSMHYVTCWLQDADRQTYERGAQDAVKTMNDFIKRSRV